MTPPHLRAAARAGHRIEHYRPQLAAAPTPERRLAIAYDWFRAAGPGPRAVDAAARELARLAERADSRAAAHGEGLPLSDSAVRQRAVETPPLRASRVRAREGAPTAV